MKLTDQQEHSLRQAIKEEDWERVHGMYDNLLHGRLEMLDQEFVKQLDDLTSDSTFWYA